MKGRTLRTTVARNGGRMSQSSTEANRYLYEQIYSFLKEEILSGKYRKGDWFPPERVLKDRFNTTHLTVRNALAKLVLEGYIERYSGKGTVVIYARDRGDVPRKTRAFPWAHLVLDSMDDGNAALLESLEAHFRKVPLALRLSFHRGDVLAGQEICREAREAGALVILQPFGVKEAPALHAELLESAVVIRSPIAGAPCPQVVLDEEGAARAAVQHLRAMGYGRIAVLASGFSLGSSGFVRGAAQELAAAGSPAGPAIVEQCGPGIDGGETAVRAVLARDPECRAFVCASDVTAAGALAGLRSAGMIPGQDCAVVGFGNTALAAGLRLTSVDPRLDLLAERTTAVILEGMSRGSFEAALHRIPPELCVRSSSARQA